MDGAASGVSVASSTMSPGGWLDGRRALLLSLAAAAIIAGLVGMHHLSVASGETARPVATGLAAGTGEGHGSAQPPMPVPHGESHDSALQHLCLAILIALAVIAVPMLMLWSQARTVPFIQTARPRPGRASRAPPSSAPARLALLCVLRT